MELKDLEKALNEERLESEVSTAQVVAYISEMVELGLINKRLSKGTTYGLKHQIERFYQRASGDENVYCSNNRVKYALFLLGCRLKRTDDDKFIIPFDSEYDIKDREDIICDAILNNGINFRYAEGEFLSQRRVLNICRELK